MNLFYYGYKYAALGHIVLSQNVSMQWLKTINITYNYNSDIL